MISEKVWKIGRQHDLTLIGTRVGEYQFFLPPYYIYSSTLFHILFNFHPLANFFQSYFWSLVSIISLFFLIKKIYSVKIAYLISLLYTISPLIVYYDRVGWNPNPLFVTSNFTIWLLYTIIYCPNPPIIYFLLLALVSGFAFSSHFTGIVLIISAFLIISIYRKWTKNRFLIFIFGLSLFFLPLLIFDLRHNWLNFHGWLDFLTIGTHDWKLISDIRRELQFILEFSGRAIIPLTNRSFLIQTTGLIVSLAFIFKKMYRLRAIICMISLVMVIMFVIYQGHQPDYYYLILIPVYLILWATLFEKLARYNLFWPVLILSIILLVKYDLNMISTPNGFNLRHKLNILRQIQKHSKNVSVTIKYNMDESWKFGFPYLITYLGMQTSPNLPISYTLVYPLSWNEQNVDVKEGDIGLIYPKSKN